MQFVMRSLPEEMMLHQSFTLILFQASFDPWFPLLWMEVNSFLSTLKQLTGKEMMQETLQ